MEEINFGAATQALQHAHDCLTVQRIWNFNLADYTYEIVMDRTYDFEQELDSEHEVGIMHLNDFTVSACSQLQ